MGVEVRPATMEDVGAIVERGIRLVDQIEANALGRGDDIEGALALGVEASECYVMVDELGPFVIGGISCKLDDPYMGIPWFICTEAMEQHRFSFARVVRDMMKRADKIYSEMEQWMWVENDKARGFAEAMGFEFDDDAVVNMNGVDFVHFHRSKPGRA